jgi:hypothetical protein
MNEYDSPIIITEECLVYFYKTKVDGNKLIIKTI